MYLPGELNVRTIAAAAKAGAAFMSTGALLTATVDGVAMGGVVRTSAHRRHVLAIEGFPAPGDKAFSLIEIVGKGGKVLARREGWRRRPDGVSPGRVRRGQLRGWRAPMASTTTRTRPANMRSGTSR